MEFNFLPLPNQHQQHTREQRGSQHPEALIASPISLTFMYFFSGPQSPSKEWEDSSEVELELANLFRTDSYRHIMHSTKLVENKFMFRIHRII